MKKADFRSINLELLKIPWDNLLNVNESDIDDVLKTFESMFFAVCDKYIPKVTVKSSFQPPWFDSELDSICKKKNKLLTKYRKAQDEPSKTKINEEIKSIRNKYRKLSTRKKRDNVLNDDIDPALIKKKFWSFFKNLNYTVSVCTLK